MKNILKSIVSVFSKVRAAVKRESIKPLNIRMPKPTTVKGDKKRNRR